VVTGRRNIVYASLGNGGIFVIPAPWWNPRRLSTFGSQPAWFARQQADRVSVRRITSIAFPEVLPATPSTLWIVVAEGGKPEQLTQATSALGDIRIALQLDGKAHWDSLFRK